MQDLSISNDYMELLYGLAHFKRSGEVANVSVIQSWCKKLLLNGYDSSAIHICVSPVCQLFSNDVLTEISTQDYINFKEALSKVISEFDIHYPNLLEENIIKIYLLVLGQETQPESVESIYKFAKEVFLTLDALPELSPLMEPIYLESKQIYHSDIVDYYDELSYALHGFELEYHNKPWLNEEAMKISHIPYYYYSTYTKPELIQMIVSIEQEIKIEYFKIKNELIELTTNMPIFHQPILEL